MADQRPLLAAAKVGHPDEMKNRMTPNKTGFVAPVDMLGMKHAVLRDPARAWESLLKLAGITHRVLDTGLKIMPTGQIVFGRVRAILYSDTVILFTEGEDEGDLWAIVLLTSQLFADALASALPLRGGIAHGQYFLDPFRNLILGLPLVEAYQVGCEAQWLGLIIDGAVADRANELRIRAGDGGPAVVDWQVPLRDGETIKRSVVNWPRVFRHGFKTQPPFSAEQIYEAFTPIFGRFEEQDPTVRAKYENTAEFVNQHLTPAASLSQSAKLDL